MDDGRPSLAGGQIEEAQLRGEILVIRATGAKGSARLMAFQGPAGSPLGVFAPHAHCRGFALSADGQWIAARLGEASRVRVKSTTGTNRPVFVVPKGKTDAGLTLTPGPDVEWPSGSAAAPPF